MKFSPTRRPGGMARWTFRAALGLALAAATAAPAVQARDTVPPPADPAAPAPMPLPNARAAEAPALLPAAPAGGPSYASASCATCGGASASCASCGGGACNGTPGCGADCHPEYGVGRFLNCVSGLICCADPCYEPKWTLLADASFHASAARPVTQTRLRGDFGYNMAFPDKGEIFWAALKGGGVALPGKGPNIRNAALNRAIDYSEGSLYTEAAAGGFGFFTSLPYRSVAGGSAYDAGSGLADIVLGTKSMMLDTELLLLTFQFTTFLPSGDSGKGLGTGHVSLEPALVSALYLCPGSYLQTEFGFRFPIGGQAGSQASVFHYSASLNRELWKCGSSWELVGTLGLDGYQIENGGYTTDAGATGRATSVGSILYATPGLRLGFCDKADFGFGPAFAVTRDRFAQQLLRFEARFRF